MVFVLVALWLAAMRRSYAAGAVFAAAVLVKLSAVDGGADAARAARARAQRRGRRLVEAAAGAAVLVAVLAILYARDLRGIWDGAFGYHLDTTGDQRPLGAPPARELLRHERHTVFLWFTVAGIAASVRRVAARVVPVAVAGRARWRSC